MSAYIESRVEKPEFFRLAPLVSGRGKRKPYVIGFDTEADTRTGRPMLMQFSLPEHVDESEAILVRVPARRRQDCLAFFIDFINEYCTRKDTEYLIYGWNLAYEFTQLFGTLPPETRDSGDFVLTLDRQDADGNTMAEYEVHVMADKRYLATFTNRSTKRQVRLLDGMSFFKTSLDNAAKMLGLGAKYEGSFDIAKTTRAALRDPEFLRYARQDAYITRRVGEHIVAMHEEFDVSTCISAPHFASKVFRHRFLRNEIRLPDPELEQAGLWSYHGGKNGFYLPGPTHLSEAFNYDITSAYPEAMRQLPNPEAVEEWMMTDDYRPGMHAIVRATLMYRRCQYRGFMQFDGHWPQSGYIEDAYLTSYELDAMVERGECDILSFHAWEMVGPPGGPLVEYVDEFFGLKARTEGPERETAKLFLNSLYGKFFQKVPLGDVGALDMRTMEWVVTDPDQPYDWRAGGLYHPPIASLITGFVRAKIHGMEHKYRSLMTSTDGIFGLEPPDERDLGKHLGGLTVQSGDLKIWRERLYVFRPDDGTKPKTAFHGFRGNSIDALEAIPLARGDHRYEGRQVITLKLSTRAIDGERYEPGRFVTRPYVLTI